MKVCFVFIFSQNSTSRLLSESLWRFIWRWVKSFAIFSQYVKDNSAVPDAFAKVEKMMNHPRLWDSELAWYYPIGTHRICLYALESSLVIYGFRPTWPFLIAKVQANRAKFLKPIAPSPFALQIFSVASMVLWPSSNSRIRKRCTFICEASNRTRRIGWLVGILWHINLCRLFNAKSIFIQIISFISNNSV